MDAEHDPAGGSADYGYDLAHEVRPPDAPAQPVAAGLTQVSTQTDDVDGDYGYDLAHDVPRTGPADPGQAARDAG